MLKIAVVLEPSDEGGYTASVPTIPGCLSEGETLTEAIANIAAAIEEHLEAVEDDLVIEGETIVEFVTWTRMNATPDQPSSAATTSGTTPREIKTAEKPLTTIPGRPTRKITFRDKGPS